MKKVKPKYCNKVFKWVKLDDKSSIRKNRKEGIDFGYLWIVHSKALDDWLTMDHKGKRSIKISRLGNQMDADNLAKQKFTKKKELGDHSTCDRQQQLLEIWNLN